MQLYVQRPGSKRICNPDELSWVFSCFKKEGKRITKKKPYTYTLTTEEGTKRFSGFKWGVREYKQNRKTLEFSWKVVAVICLVEEV